jgi:hypothetical protein
MASVVPVEGHFVTGEPVEGAMGNGRASKGPSSCSTSTSFPAMRKLPGEPVTKA